MQNFALGIPATGPFDAGMSDFAGQIVREMRFMSEIDGLNGRAMYPEESTKAARNVG